MPVVSDLSAARHGREVLQSLGSTDSRLGSPARRPETDDIGGVQNAGHRAKNLLERFLLADPVAEEPGRAPKRLALTRSDGAQYNRRRTHMERDAPQRRRPLADLPDPEADLVPLALPLLAVAGALPVVEFQVASERAEVIDGALQIEPQFRGSWRLANRPAWPPTAEQDDLGTGSSVVPAVAARRSRRLLAATGSLDVV